MLTVADPARLDAVPNNEEPVCCHELGVGEEVNVHTDAHDAEDNLLLSSKGWSFRVLDPEVALLWTMGLVDAWTPSLPDHGESWVTVKGVGVGETELVLLVGELEQSLSLTVVESSESTGGDTGG